MSVIKTNPNRAAEYRALLGTSNIGAEPIGSLKQAAIAIGLFLAGVVVGRFF